MMKVLHRALLSSAGGGEGGWGCPWWLFRVHLPEESSLLPRSLPPPPFPSRPGGEQASLHTLQEDPGASSPGPTRPQSSRFLSYQVDSCFHLLGQTVQMQPHLGETHDELRISALRSPSWAAQKDCVSSSQLSLQLQLCSPALSSRLLGLAPGGSVISESTVS